jgi:hypothetical protein
MNSNEKKDIVDGTVYRYSSNWIHELESELHWRYYWIQLHLMQGRIQPGDHVLEIGPGSHFTANYLRSKGIQVTTVDIDPEKKPDIVTNIVTWDWPKSWDHILAYEVMEHLPFEKAKDLLKVMNDHVRKNLFVSVPVCEYRLFRCEWTLPFIGRHVLDITIPRHRILASHHFWELGLFGQSKNKLESLFRNFGYVITEQKKVWSLQYSVLKNKDE